MRLTFGLECQTCCCSNFFYEKKERGLNKITPHTFKVKFVKFRVFDKFSFSKSKQKQKYCCDFTEKIS